MAIISNYYENDRSLAIINALKKVYDLKENTITTNVEISLLINFYHYCGFMLKKRYLPSEIFKKGSGISMIRLYAKLEPTILSLRKNNPMYSDGFEYLYKRAKKYHSTFQ